MQKTYREIFEFIGRARHHLAQHEQKGVDEVFDKLGSLVTDGKLNPAAKSIIEQYAKAYKSSKAIGETKWTYALQRMLKRCDGYLGNYNEEISEISINNCATDKDDVILRDERDQLKFTKEGLIARNKEQKKLNEKSVKIESYYAQADVPKDLTGEDIEAFTGFVIPEKKAK